MGNCCSADGGEASMSDVVAARQTSEGYVLSRKAVPVALTANKISPSAVAARRSSHVSEGREDQISFGLSGPGPTYHSGSTIDWVAQLAETERVQQQQQLQQYRQGAADAGNRAPPLAVTAGESSTQPYHSSNKIHELRHLCVDLSADDQQFSDGSNSHRDCSDDGAATECPLQPSPALATTTPRGAPVLPLTRGNLVALEQSTIFDDASTAERRTEGFVTRVAGTEGASVVTPNAQVATRHASWPGEQRPPTLPSFRVGRQSSVTETHISVGSRRTAMSHSPHLSSTATTGQVLAMLMADGSHGSQSASVCSYVPLQMPRHLITFGEH